MNNGKVCISVAGETADGMVEKIRRAVPLADVVEVRFDHLTDEEIVRFRRETSDLRFEKPLIATYRSTEQGGKTGLTPEQRRAFWAEPLENFWAADVEEDVIDAAARWPYRIVSYHSATCRPAEIGAIYSRLCASDADAVKIAINVMAIEDAAAIWRLLDVHTSRNKPLIPIAMGEAGKWTRILGPGRGAFMTYAALEEGSETAAGQLTAHDLLDVYRVKELDLETKVYGVMGDPVSASLSPYIHNAAFAMAGLNAVFVPLEVKDIDAFFTQMVLSAGREVELNFAGFAVTMPHKVAAMRYLDETDETAKRIGAINTIAIENGRFLGHNTDATGFISILQSQIDVSGMRAAVLGAGGAARACVDALQREAVDVTVFARDASKAARFAEQLGVRADAMSDLRSRISGFDILINATPVGMKSEIASFAPLTARELKGVKLVFDLVTSAMDTPLIEQAKQAGIKTIPGVEMLIEQAVEQFEIWTGREAPRGAMRQAAVARMERCRER